jgi:hypothetical protein
VRIRLLGEFNIEIGAGLGPLAGKIWRVGLMGASSAPWSQSSCSSVPWTRHWRPGPGPWCERGPKAFRESLRQ